ncbi:MAG: helix-turn-helix transcriptional regulator [Acidimicrobiia bacterium]
MQKVIERILNLLAYLLTSERPVTADDIRTTVAGYAQVGDDAWRRMFERDKSLLRDLGIPLELRPTDGWAVEHGYVVPAASYALPDPGLTDEERAALYLAAHAVRLGGEASGSEALFKLGGAPLTAGGEPLAADLGADGDALAAAFTGVADHRTLSFEYRDRARIVEPFGLVHRRGHWYVVGAERTDGRIVKAFRLDRAQKVEAVGAEDAFTRPEGFRAGDSIPAAAWEAGPEDLEATVAFDADVAWWARRQLTGRSEVQVADDGALTAVLPVANPDAFVGWVLSFDGAAEIVEPPQLREALLERVEAAG